MARALWVRPTGNTKEVATAAIEAGADGLLVDERQRSTVQGLGRLPIATVDGADITFEDGTGRIVPIASPEDQEQARALIGKVDALVVAPEDWTVIPLENLVAWAQGEPTQLYARVTSAEDTELALGTLETGVHGVVLETDEPATVRAVAQVVLPQVDEVELVEAEVTGIEDAGMGDRVCVDTTSLLAPEEGLLVGSASSFLALVASEAQESGYVSARPFRVNAGAVHAYVQADAQRTRYLSEVRAGTRLMVVDKDGHARTVTTGRAKIERRPMLVVHLKAGDREGSIVVQNAETIRLVTPGGTKSVAELAVGDTVLVHLAHAGGRHFGQAIEETIQEV